MHNLLQSHILKDILKQIFDIISVYAMLRPPMMRVVLFIFFQAEDGIRDYKVTGVQTCALPICTSAGIGQTTVAPPPLRQNETTVIAFGSCNREDRPQPLWTVIGRQKPDVFVWQIGRASCREGVSVVGVAGAVEYKTTARDGRQV